MILRMGQMAALKDITDEKILAFVQRESLDTRTAFQTLRGIKECILVVVGFIVEQDEDYKVEVMPYNSTYYGNIHVVPLSWLNLYSSRVSSVDYDWMMD